MPVGDVEKSDMNIRLQFSLCVCRIQFKGTDDDKDIWCICSYAGSGLAKLKPCVTYISHAHTHTLPQEQLFAAVADLAHVSLALYTPTACT